MNTRKITIHGEVKEYPADISYMEIAKEYQKDYKDDIILVSIDGRLRELFKQEEGDCKLEFITTGETDGYLTYLRGMVFVMMRAIYRAADRTKLKRVCVEYSIGDALFCEVEGDVIVDENLMIKLKQEMYDIIKQDIPFEKRTIATEEAVELFHQYKMYDKEKLFRYRRVSKTNIYSLDGFEDYYYGYMPPSTGMLKVFDLKSYKNGFFLILPSKNDTKHIKEFFPKVKLFSSQQESNKWGKTMGIENVGSLNEQIANGNIGDLILVQEAFQEKKIAEIAEQIKKAKGSKFIMIAGPSSSGKTTFSHRLSIQLRTLGFKPHPIAIDNYFLDREKTPRDANGNYNFEVLEAIDIEKFNEDMTNLLHGKRVELPSFNFKTGKREYKGNIKQLGKEDILVIEGIHGLNDKLSYSLPRESKFKIYISALTQLNIDEHNRIPTTDGRLIRRMVRDSKTRGATAKDTIAMWPSVRKGEEENIFPFQEECDCMFNSALIYELSVLKQYAEPLLFSIGRECSEYQEAKRLLKFLDYFLGVSTEDIPKNSILREFVGGSCFKV